MSCLRSAFLPILVLLYALLVSCNAQAVDKAVITLHEDNFQSYLAAKDLLFVKFYAPWCGHCKKLKPEFALAAKHMKKHNPPVYFAQVDAIANKELARAYKIDSFPMIKLFEKGEEVSVDNVKTAGDIVTWLRNRIAAVKARDRTVTTLQELDTLLRASPLSTAVIGILDTAAQRESFVQASLLGVSDAAQTPYACTSAGSPVAKALSLVSGGDGGAMIAIVAPQGRVLQGPGPSATSTPTASSFSATPYKGDPTNPDALDSFVVHNRLPLVARFEPITAKVAFQSPFNTHALLFLREPRNGITHGDEKDDTRGVFRPESEVQEEFDELIATMETAAAEFRSHGSTAPRFLYVPYPGPGMISRSSMSLVKHYGVELGKGEIQGTENPRFVLARMSGGKSAQYRLPEDKPLTPAAIVAFIQSSLGGEGSRHFKSQPAPTAVANHPGGKPSQVTVVVGTTFSSLVLDPSKDVLLMYYAPWCPHCKAFALTYEILATRFGSIDSLVIAKIDATANEVNHPSADVSGFPKLKLYRSDDKQSPVLFSGPRTEAQVADFIMKHVSIPFTELPAELSQEQLETHGLIVPANEGEAAPPPSGSGAPSSAAGEDNIDPVLAYASG